MSDEHKLLAERELGAKAAHILDNQVYKDVWERLDANMTSLMSDPATPDEQVLEARKGLIVLRRVKKEIEHIFQTGQMATIQLDK